MPERECPMCGETMRLVTREVVTRVPGTAEQRPQRVTDWECPDCDYFEEAEADERKR